MSRINYHTPERCDLCNRVAVYWRGTGQGRSLRIYYYCQEHSLRHGQSREGLERISKELTRKDEHVRDVEGPTE